MNKYSLHKIFNGLRVVMIPNQNTQAVTVLVMVKAGSRQEAARINGAAHFVEHMMFKGSRHYPRSTDISHTLESVGAEFNAFTSKEYTGYYIKVAASQLELALQILSDMLITPKFSQSELVRERGVILEEIKMTEDNPAKEVYNLYDSLLYQSHPLARPISGPQKVIKQISRGDLLKFKNTLYSGPHSVVAVAGNFSKQKCQRLISNYFRHYNPSRSETAVKEFISRQSNPRLKLKYKDTKQAHLALGFPAFADEDPKSRTARLLSVILGAGMSSRLFVEVREKRGLCYSIFATTNTYQDTGDFMIKAGLDKDRLEPAVALICRELRKLKRHLVGVRELKKAKEYIKGNTVLNLEDSEAQAGWYAREVIFSERVTTPQERLKQIEQITAREIQKTARVLFHSPRVNLSIIGPYRDVYKTKLINLLRI